MLIEVLLKVNCTNLLSSRLFIVKYCVSVKNFHRF